MVTTVDARALIAQAILDSPIMPDNLDVILREPDGAGRDAQKTLPLLYVDLEETERNTEANTDRVGVSVDESSNEGQVVYGIDWEAQATIELWTADGSGDMDADELGRRVRRVLSRYDSHVSGKPFCDENGDPVETIWYFSLQSGERADDLTGTPSIRRWRETAEVYGTRYVKEPPQPTVTSTDQNVDSN